MRGVAIVKRVRQGRRISGTDAIYFPYVFITGMADMFTVMLWLVAIPMLVMSVKFWLRCLKFLLTNQRDIATRVQRARTAYAAGMHDEE
jgi:hypothetical protein